MDDETEDKIKQALENMDACGVATIRASDSQLFLFKKSKIKALLDEMEANGDQHCIIMVKMVDKDSPSMEN
jgi:hypothetical protein